MLTDLCAWTEEFLRRLLDAFPQRLIFAGLQGSYGRGEATPESDIDLVVIPRGPQPDALRRWPAAFYAGA